MRAFTLGGWFILLLLVWAAGAAEPSAAPTGGATISYALPGESVVTLNVLRPDGWVVRELVVGEKQAAGEHQVFWDGRDNNGRLLPAGEYSSRVLTHQGLTWEYVTSIGNGGTPPWMTKDGTGGWGGNHGNPVAAASDSTGVYLGWNSTEGPYCIVKRTHDGTKGIWGSTLGPFEGVLALASDDKCLYGANARRLIKINRETGRQMATVNIKTDKPADAKGALVEPAGSVSFNFFREDQGGFLWGLAAGDGRVYLSNPWRNAVEVFDAEKLKPLPEENLTVNRPRGLALDGKGNLLVVSEGKVLSVELKTKAAKPFLTQDLESPFALARGVDGTLYLTELPAQQVKKFSADGKLLATFGRKGGGTDLTEGGPFQPQDLRIPCALAVVPDGNVYIVEDMIPKRIARFSPDGKLLGQWFGSVNYAATITPNPNDPAEVFSTMWAVFTARVDYEKKTWEIGRLLKVKWGEGGLGKLDCGDDPQRLIAREGKTYMWTGKGLYVVEEKTLRPVLYFSPRIPDKPKPPEKSFLAELAEQRKAKNRGWNTDAAIWCDLNGDAAVQAEEIQFVPLPDAKHGPQFFGANGLTDEFSLITYGYTWKPKSFTPAGAPVYEPAGLVKAAKYNPLDFPFDAERFMQDHAGNAYGIMNYGAPGGDGFWGARCGGNAVVSYAPDWRPRWTVGRHAHGAANPGEMYYLWKTDGEAANCVFVTDVEGLVHVVHQDGFYVQSLLADGRRNPPPGSDVLRVENFSGSVLTHPQTKKHYLYISSEQAGHVFEIKGLDTIKTTPPEKLTLLSPALPAAARAAREKGEYVIKRAPPGARTGEQNAVPNYGVNWTQDVVPLLVYRDGKLAAELRLLYDDRMLYVRAEVLSDSPYHNSTIAKGDKGFRYAHLSGDTVEMLLGLDAAADAKRTQPVKGDLRVVYADSWPHNRGVACQQPVLGGEKGNPFAYEGASGKVTLEDAGFWSDKEGVRANCSAPLHRNGYTLDLAIPLDRLRLKGGNAPPLAGRRIRFDAGVMWGEPFGKNRVKAYWRGQNPKMLLTDDLAVETQLHPDGWGSAVFDEQQPPAAGHTLAAVKVSQPPSLDGKSEDWKSAEAASIPGPAGDVGSVRAAYDDENFYAVVQVSDGTPLKNRSAAPELLFKGGDMVAFAFGPAGGQGALQKAAFAKVNDKQTVKMLYRPQSAEKKPYTFKSPVGTVTFDYVAPLAEGNVRLAAKGDGYVAGVAIPWKLLGYTPKPGLQFPFDVQIVFSDAGGNTNAYVAWWHSRSAESGCTVDIPTEAKLYPDQWGKLVLK